MAEYNEERPGSETGGIESGSGRGTHLFSKVDDTSLGRERGCLHSQLLIIGNLCSPRLPDEECMLIDINLHAGRATVELEKYFGAVLQM
jgi:hypothetical protein